MPSIPKAINCLIYFISVLQTQWIFILYKLFKDKKAFTFLEAREISV